MLKNKFIKYLAYAIGEIVLVVIGILIAVQINNHNESIKRNKELRSILKNVTYDLITDTTIVANYIKIEEDMIKSSNRILNKEITPNNYKECPLCTSITTTYRPLTINIKGFEQLKSIINEGATKQDSLLTDITQFYTIYIDLISGSNEVLKNEALENVEAFRQFEWFVDWTQGTYNQDMITYFVSSEDYRKRVAAYNILAIKNHLQYLKSFKLNAAHIINEIEKRLNE